jgi:hypothetical protein
LLSDFLLVFLQQLQATVVSIIIIEMKILMEYVVNSCETIYLDINTFLVKTLPPLEISIK